MEASYAAVKHHTRSYKNWYSWQDSNLQATTAGDFETPAFAISPQEHVKINGRCSATELRVAEAARQDSNLRPLPLRWRRLDVELVMCDGFEPPRL